MEWAQTSGKVQCWVYTAYAQTQLETTYAQMQLDDKVRSKATQAKATSWSMLCLQRQSH